MVGSSAVANSDNTILYTLSSIDSGDFDDIFIRYNATDGTILGSSYKVNTS